MWVGVIVAVVGAGVSAYGMYQSGKSQEAMASANARSTEAMNNYNQKVAENEAIAKEQQSHAESLQMRKDKERLQASQRAGYSKSGAIMTEGTPLLVMAEQAGMMELDILNAQRNRALEASAIRSGARLSDFSSKSKAEMMRYSGSQAAKAATIGAGGTLLSGVGSGITSVATYKAAKTP